MDAIKRHPRRVIAVVCAAMIIIGAVTGFLWYTRPRSWESISYSGDLTRFSAIVHTYELNGGAPGFKTYELNEEDGLEAPGRQILALLEETTYRVRPWDTLEYRYSSSYGETGSTSMTIYLMWDQDQQAEYLTFYSSGTICKGRTVYTAKDGVNLFKSISAVIQEYGTQSE